jgi:hypothetical protein
MKILGWFCLWFYRLWITLASVVLIAAIVLDFYKQGLFRGFLSLRDALSPFNIGNFIFIGLVFLPAIIARLLYDKIQQRIERP